MMLFARQAMEFLLNLIDPCTFFLLFVVLVISLIIYVETWGADQKEPEPEESDPEPELEPKKTKLRLLRLPLVAFKECMLSMDLSEINNLSLCSKNTNNTIKLFKGSYFKCITNCEIEFSEECGTFKFSTPTSLTKCFFFDKQREKDVFFDEGTCYFNCYNPLKESQKFAKQFLELSDCREVRILLFDRTSLLEFVSWGNNFESSIKSVHSFEDSGEDAIFDLLKYFDNWKRVVLIHRFNEYHLNQTNENISVSIISCDDYGTLVSFWKLPHQSIHFSKDTFDVYYFIGYLRRWIESSIPCTELVDLSAELYLPNYFDSFLRSVKFEVIDEEWIHPIHGKINYPSYKIQRSDRKKSALLFRFQKDGEPCLGMHIY